VIQIRKLKESGVNKMDNKEKQKIKDVLLRYIHSYDDYIKASSELGLKDEDAA